MISILFGLASIHKCSCELTLIGPKRPHVFDVFEAIVPTFDKI